MDKQAFRVSELRGYKSLRAFWAYNGLLMGLKMLPAYMAESYNEFYSRLNQMDPIDQEKMIREAAFFVQLNKDEVEAIVACCIDPNGVPYSSASLNTLGPDAQIDMIVAVAMKIADIKIDMITEEEKKN